MDPWCKVATPRAQVRKGRSFNPDEFAIALDLLEGWRLSCEADRVWWSPEFRREAPMRGLRGYAGGAARRKRHLQYMSAG